MAGERVLVIDDDVSLSRVIGYQLESSGFQVDVVNRGQTGLKLFQDNPHDIVVTDIQMPDLSGIEVLQDIRRQSRKTIIILITAYGSVDNAIEACRLGADDYLTKPFGQEQLLFVIEKALRLHALQQENQHLRRELRGRNRVENFITADPATQLVLETVGQVAETNATALIHGESGTGKELVARAIHYQSPRARKPLITVNCPSIPDNLLESELFGHVKGAFTGALKDRKGKFELAQGGSIFLDEIGDLQESVQAKLLRVLQEHEIERLGDSRVMKIDVRVIAATNKDLWELVQAGQFREDLYYRLSVIPIQLPPLRERQGDIPLLIKHFEEKHHAPQPLEWSAETMSLLEVYAWPGNVRELENLIQRLVTLHRSGPVDPEHLPPHLLEGSGNRTQNQQRFLIPPEGLPLEDMETALIEATLAHTRGNQSQAAKLLQVPRHVLIYRMKKLGLTES